MNGFHLLGALVILAVLIAWGFRWAEQGRIDVGLKSDIDDAPIHAQVTQIRSWREPASKGFRPGFTKDDAVVDIESRRRLATGRFGDRRVQ